MMDERYYIGKIEELFSKKGIQEVNDKVIEKFSELVEEQYSAYSNAFIKKDIKGLEKLLEGQRKLRKIFTIAKNEYPYRLIILITQFVQNYNIYNKLLLNMKNEKATKEDIRVIEKRHSHARKVIFYLYHHVHVRHAELVDNLEMPRSSVTDLMKILEDAGVVESTRGAKVVFYDLTNEGRKYVKDQEPEEENIIIDYEKFVRNSREISEEKLKYVRFENRASFLFKKEGYLMENM